ncbi:MFS transporter [Brucella ceti]|uniref:MFS transporter n=1 Tax=Brucella ceti TaxID=120577 RepID=UPI0035D4E06C
MSRIEDRSLNGIAAADNGLTLVEMPEEAKTYLTKGMPAYRNASLALFLSGFATFSLLYCVQPLMPLFAKDFSITPTASSLSLSLSTGFLAFAIFFAAIIAERFGRKSLMFASLLGSALCTIGCAVVPDWHMLLALRSLQGLLLGGVPAVAMSYLAEEIDPRGLGASMGLYIAGNAFGGMAGRVITGTLAEYYSWRPALAVMGLLGLAAAIGFWALLPTSRNFTPRTGLGARFHVSAWLSHLRNPALPMLIAIGFLVMGSFVTIYNYIGFRLIEPPYNLSQTELGFIFTVYLFGIAASWSAGRIGDRLGHFTMLPIALAVEAAGCLLTLSASLPIIVGGIIFLTVGFFMSYSVASALVGRLALEIKGHASSLYLLAYYLGSSIAGSAGGYFWTADGWWAVADFTFAMLALAFAAALAAAWFAREGQTDKPGLTF